MVLFVLTGLFLLVPDDKSVTYAPDRGGLVVRFPAKLVISSQFTETTEVDLSEATLTHQGISYKASFSRIPRVVLDSMPRDKVVELYLHSTPLNPKYGGRVIEDSKLRRGDISFHTYILQYPTGNSNRWTKLLLGIVNHNLIVIDVEATTQEELKGADVKMFFDSFDVRNKK